MCRSPVSLLWLVLYTRGAWCLRMLSLHVPSRVVVGDNIRLSCGFDLEGDPLYSIKWYRNDVEFFRFVPRDRPPGQYFPMEGVNINMLLSANHSVLLEDVDSTTSGKYKCEVSADAPSFQTEAVFAVLTVKDFYDLSCSVRLNSCPLLAFGIFLLLAFL